MEKLLNAIASRLAVRVIVEEQTEQTLEGVLTVSAQMFNHRDVTDEVRNQFKMELNRHLANKLQDIEVGEYVDYNFDFGPVRPLGTLMEEANDNLAEVLLTLPALRDGESYDFPCDTFILFTLTGRDDKKATVKPDMVCPWIKEAYEKQ